MNDSSRSDGMQRICNVRTWLGAACVSLGVSNLWAQTIPTNISVQPRVSTGSVKTDADDPAIWIHPKDPAKSVILGTDKSGSSSGIYVWDMSGKQLQFVAVANPNNVDVRYGFKLGNRKIDIAATNPRQLKEIKVLEINQETGLLTDITTSPGIKTPELDTPYGITLYRRPSDGAMFAIESSKDGASAKNLHQYRLEHDGAGKVKGTFVRTIGNGVIGTVVEGLTADDQLGYIYACEEPTAVRKFYADPSLGKSAQIVAFATNDGISGDREGVAVYSCIDGTGYILVSSQGNTTVKVYRREGEGGDPHKHTLLTTIKTNGSSDTDGLEVTNRPTSAQFPKGFLVTHHSSGKQFRLYAWEDIAKDYMTICTAGSPQTAVSESEHEIAAPLAFELEQNYPNPFNPETTIRFRAQEAGYVELAILDLLGRRVRTLLAATVPSGELSVKWDGRDDLGQALPSGTYAYRLESAGQVQTKKLVLLK
jgi:3-phytase